MTLKLNCLSDHLDVQPGNTSLPCLPERLFNGLQGVVASGLAALSAASGDTSLLDQAEITLDATVSRLTVNNILKESCDDVDATKCDHDQQIFKVREARISFFSAHAKVLCRAYGPNIFNTTSITQTT